MRWPKQPNRPRWPGRSQTVRAGLNPLLLGAATLCVALASGSTGPRSTIVCSEGFDAPRGTAYPHWSSARIEYASKVDPNASGRLPAQPIYNVESPNFARLFLGEFGGPRLDPKARTRVRQTVSLTLDHLPPHRSATVSFELLILKSWDGDSPAYGPDRWSMRVRDGPRLLDATFSNNPKTATEGSFQSYPKKGSRPQSGATSVNTLRYHFFGDSIYHFRLPFRHTGNSLLLDFSSDLFEGKGTDDESWGLDDVKVTVR